MSAGAPVRLPRAAGAVRIVSKARDGASVLDALRHQGSAKALFPRDPESAALEATLMNTAGGVTDGDRFDIDAGAGAGSWLRISTPAAERAYRARAGGRGRITAALRAEPGARLHWTPQETILYDHSALERRITVELAGDAEFLGLETLVFGRAAMGERLNDFFFSEQWRLRRDGRLIFADALRFDGLSQHALARPALLGGAMALSSLVFASAKAEPMVAAVRRALPVRAGASLLAPDLLVARVLSEDAASIRRVAAALMEMLAGAPAPKVWRV